MHEDRVEGAAGDRLVLYVRAGCHLCEAARAVVAEVAAATGAGWHEVDIDTGAPGAPAVADLVASYGELVPVVTVDGVQQGYWRLDAARLRRVLGR